jgi:hypothetical protein
MTLDELDRLHAAATAGRWYRDERGYMPGVAVSLAFDGSPTLDGRSILRGNIAWPAECRANEDFAMHVKNAWPSVSARLRAAEAVLGLLVACDDMINDGGEPPVSRAALADMARAALPGRPPKEIRR